MLIIEDSKSPNSRPRTGLLSFACVSSSADAAAIAEDIVKDDSIDKFEIIDISA